MALATKCPYCGTIFRVASDQLKLRGGIVRCGLCSEAFDGNAGLIDPAAALQAAPLAEPALAEAAKPALAPELPLHYLAAPDIAPAAAQDQTDHQTDLEPEPEFDLDLDFDLDAEPATQSAIEPASDFLSKAPPERHWIDLAALTAADEARLQREAGLMAVPSVAAPAPEAGHAPSPEAEVKHEIEARSKMQQAPEARHEIEAEPEIKYEAAPASDPVPDTETDTEDKTSYEAKSEADAERKAELDSEEPEFITQGRRKQRNGKALGVLTGLGVLLLLLVLLAQGVMTFGSQLAAQAPQLKPALTEICRILGCRIALPMQIKAIAIELGELQTLNAGTFSYATVLHNNSSTVQAWPNIELILTDGADKAVLRRAFTPRDYLGAQLDANPGFAAHSEQALKLYFELTRINASGYHIAVFYP